MVSPIRVLLVDDHPLVRQSLRFVLGLVGNIVIVGEAHNGREAVQACHTLQPDIILMDLIMPQLDGIEATRIICQNYPQTRVLALSYCTPGNALALAALRAGASEYLDKQISSQRLIEAIMAASKKHSDQPQVTVPEPATLKQSL